MGIAQGCIGVLAHDRFSASALTGKQCIGHCVMLHVSKIEAAVFQNKVVAINGQ